MPDSSASLTLPEVSSSSYLVSDAKPVTASTSSLSRYSVRRSEPSAPRSSSIVLKSSPVLNTDEKTASPSLQRTLNSISQPKSERSDTSFISLGVSILVAPNPIKTILELLSRSSPLLRLILMLPERTATSLSQASAIGSRKRLSPNLPLRSSSSFIMR